MMLVFEFANTFEIATKICYLFSKLIRDIYESLWGYAPVLPTCIVHQARNSGYPPPLDIRYFFGTFAKDGS